METLLQPLPRWLGPAVLSAVLLLFAMRNLPWHLDNFDQAKQAYVSFEMVKDGAWWFQHTPTGRIATKPPLAGWISAGLERATGYWDLAWRLPPFAASVLLMGLLAKGGRRLGGEAGAVLAIAAFGFNLMIPRLATLVRTDMLLGLSIFLVGYLIFEKLRTESPWSTADRWKLCGLLLVSMLLKGPIAYAFLLPGLAALGWLGRRTGWGRRAWSGWWSWLLPLCIFGVWVGVGIASSPEFYHQVVEKEFLGRFTVGEEAVHHNQPIYFYATNLLHLFFPWSALLLGLACVPDVRAKVRRDPALCWLVCWALGGLLFMSLVPSKRADRIFPVVPPLCLLAAGLMPLLPRWKFERWLAVKPLIYLVAGAFVLTGGYAAFRVMQGYREQAGALVAFGRAVRYGSSGEDCPVVNDRDEGILLYLQTSHFMDRKAAKNSWQAGSLSRLVLPQSLLASFPKSPPYRVALTSQPAEDKGRYVLLERTEPAAVKAKGD